MTCRQWIDEGHMACVDKTDEWSASCTSWADEGQSKCDNWADEGSNECSNWADQGKNECSDWSEKHCHWYSPWNCVAGWFCQAYYWVSNWICQAWYWVAKWVCKGWYWVAKWVCKAFVYVVKFACLLWSWIAKLVCVAWEWARCSWKGLFGSKHRFNSPVSHVFVLVLENRSFDHMLGHSMIRGVEVGVDPDQPFHGQERLVNGVLDGSGSLKPGMSNSYQNGTINYFEEASLEAKLQLVEPDDFDPPHEFKNAIRAVFDDTYKRNPDGSSNMPSPAPMSGFLRNYALGNEDDKKPNNLEQVMRGYSAKSTPVIDALAREFALLDRWHSSLPGPTWPNRFFVHAASSGGLDDSPSLAATVGNIAFDGYTFANGTIFDRLDDECIEWQIFSGDFFPVSLGLSGMTIADLQGKISHYADFADAVSEKSYSPKYTFIEPDYGHIWSDYHCGNSQHPMDDITRGERFIKHVYEHIRSSPHWETSVLLITYDEHGGFFDHVPPPAGVVPGDGVADEDNNHHDFAFDLLGVRVPAIVVSPLIDRNLLDGTLYDHSSIPKTLENLFALKPLTERDAKATGFDHLLSRKTARTDAPETLPEPAHSDFECIGDDWWRHANYERTGEDGLGSSASALQEGEGRQPVREEKSAMPSSTTVGFLQVAYLRALATARGRDHPRIKREFAAVTTEGGARHFMAKTAVMVAPDVRTARHRTLLGKWFPLPQKRRWIPTPLQAYRRGELDVPPAPIPPTGPATAA